MLGPNGSGKTNILEAIALATTVKSFKMGAKNSEFIRHGERLAGIRAQFSSAVDFNVQITIGEKSKQVKVADKIVTRASSLLQRAALVTFTPDDLNIVLGSSTNRRRALDQLALSLSPCYADSYRNYEKTLWSRNRLLKEPRQSAEEIAVYTKLLVESGCEIVNQRLQALSLLQEHFQQQLAILSHNQLSAKIHYEASFSGTHPNEQAFYAFLKTHHREEIARRTTIAGPHLDDIIITLHGQNSRTVASRGQARSLVLAWKIAHLLTAIEYRKANPILLLDDVVGELDLGNAERLMELITRLGIQTFMSTTHLETLPTSCANISPESLIWVT